MKLQVLPAGPPAPLYPAAPSQSDAMMFHCLSQALGTVGAVNKFKFFSLSVTLWHFPYSSTET